MKIQTYEHENGYTACLINRTLVVFDKKGREVRHGVNMPDYIDLEKICSDIEYRIKEANEISRLSDKIDKVIEEILAYID